MEVLGVSDGPEAVGSGCAAGGGCEPALLHPMDVKKRLARTITAGFHGEAAAQHADENWARMFQQKEAAEDLEEVHIAYADLVSPSCPPGELQIRVSKLLLQTGTGCQRGRGQPQACREGRQDRWRSRDQCGKFRWIRCRRGLVVRLGKRAKAAVIGGVWRRRINLHCSIWQLVRDVFIPQAPDSAAI